MAGSPPGVAAPRAFSEGTVVIPGERVWEGPWGAVEGAERAGAGGGEEGECVREEEGECVRGEEGGRAVVVQGSPQTH